MIFVINDQKFKTKNEAIIHFKQRFQDKWKANEELTEDDMNLLRILLKNREDFENDYVNKITSFRITTNRFNAFEIQYEFESAWISFSIERCIIGTSKSPKAKMNSTLREAINSQILQFREANPVRVCKLCKSENSIQVDHESPTFQSLVSSFLSYNNVQCLNPENIAEFEKYHLQRAKLRYLCQACNQGEYNKIAGRKRFYTPEQYTEINRQRSRERYIPKKNVISNAYPNSTEQI